MSNWIVGGICFVVGALFGMFITAVLSLTHNTREYHTEEELEE